jgi:hypothetical protein
MLSLCKQWPFSRRSGRAACPDFPSVNTSYSLLLSGGKKKKNLTVTTTKAVYKG